MEEDCTHFIELGPKPVLLSMGKRCVQTQTATWLPSLQSGMDDWSCLLDSLGILYGEGASVDWHGFDRHYHRTKLALPTYPFERKTYWMGSSRSKKTQEIPQSRQGHPLLGERLRSALSMVQFESFLSTQALPYLRDHCIQGSVVLPGVAYLEMAYAAASETLDSTQLPALSDVAFHQALFVPETTMQTVQVLMFPATSGETSFQVFSLPTDGDKSKDVWTLHASGRIRLGPVNGQPAQPRPASLLQLKARCHEAISSSDLYQNMARYGLQYGPFFQGVQQLWRGEHEALGQIQLPQDLTDEAADYHSHPALMDASIQVLAATVLDNEDLSVGGATYMPVGLANFRVYGRLKNQVWSHAVLQPSREPGANIVEGDVSLFDEAGHLMAEFLGLKLQRLGRSAQQAPQGGIDEWLYKLEWQPKTQDQSAQIVQPEPTARPVHWLIFADSEEVGHRLGARLGADGEAVTFISPGASFDAIDSQHIQINPTCQELYANWHY